MQTLLLLSIVGTVSFANNADKTAQQARFLEDLMAMYEFDGSGSGEETTQMPDTTTTVSTSTTPPTTPPPTGIVPPNLDGVTYEVSLSVKYSSNYTTDLDDSKTEEYIRMKHEVERTLRPLYRDATSGMGFQDIVVHSFRKGSVIAIYGAQYDADTILKNASLLDTIFWEIDNTVLPALKNETIDSSPVNPNYIDDVVLGELAAEEKKLKYEVCHDPCNATGACDFPQRCYSESPEEECQGIIQLVCVEPCYDVEGGLDDTEYRCDKSSQYCVIEDSEPKGKCTCKPNYLPAVGTDYKCFHQDILIGVCAGLGGALILLLIISTVYFACRSTEKEYKLETSSDIVELISDEGKNNKTGVEGPALGDAASESSPQTPRSQPESSKEAIEMDDVKISTDYDNALPATNGTNFDTVDNEDDLDSTYRGVAERDLYHRGEVEDETVRELMGTDIYKNFEPQLENIDPYAPVFANRPQINLVSDPEGERSNSSSVSSTCEQAPESLSNLL